MVRTVLLPLLVAFAHAGVLELEQIAGDAASHIKMNDASLQASCATSTPPAVLGATVTSGVITVGLSGVATSCAGFGMSTPCVENSANAPRPKLFKCIVEGTSPYATEAVHATNLEIRTSMGELIDVAPQVECPVPWGELVNIGASPGSAAYLTVQVLFRDVPIGAPVPVAMNTPSAPAPPPPPPAYNYRIRTPNTGRREEGNNNCWDVNQIQALDASGNTMTLEESNVATSGEHESYPLSRLVDGDESTIWGGRPDYANVGDCQGQPVTTDGCAACACEQWIAVMGLTPNPATLRLKQGGYSTNACAPSSNYPLYVERQPAAGGAWEERSQIDIAASWQAGWNDIPLN